MSTESAHTPISSIHTPPSTPDPKMTLTWTIFYLKVILTLNFLARMYHMLEACGNVFKLATVFNGDISSWEVSSVTDMRDVFYQAHKFDNDISS